MITPDRPDTAPDPRRWGALLVTLAGGFLVLLDVTIVTVAVPSIQQGLGASPSGVQWVVSGYPLTFGLALVAGGRLGDAFGRRRMYLIALTGFAVTSALAGAAPTLALLVVARLVQGLAGGLLTPQNAGLIQDMFRGEERGRAFGLLGVIVGLSTAVGPVLGGLIIDVFGEDGGWRWVFLVNVPVAAVALALAARLVPRTGPGTERVDIDVTGIVLLGLAVLCLLFPIVQSESDGLRRFWWLFAVAVACAAAFVRWQRRRVASGRAPVLDFRLFTATAGYPSGAVLATVYFAGFSGVWLVFALYFQNGLGLSPLESGLAMTPFAIGATLSSEVAGRLVHRFGRWVTIAGLVIVVLGFTAVILVVWLGSPDRMALWVAVPLLVAGFGGGAVISPNLTLTLSNVPSGMAGVASGLMQTGQRMGTAVGTALLAAVFHAVAADSRFSAGLAAALLCAVGLVLVALVLASWEQYAARLR